MCSCIVFVYMLMIMCSVQLCIVMGGRYIKSQYYYYSHNTFYRAQNSHSVRFAYAVMLTICIITGKLDNQKFGNLLITTLIFTSDAGTVNKQFHFNHNRIAPVHECVLAHNSQLWNIIAACTLLPLRPKRSPKEFIFRLPDLLAFLCRPLCPLVGNRMPSLGVDATGILLRFPIHFHILPRLLMADVTTFDDFGWHAGIGVSQGCPLGFWLFLCWGLTRSAFYRVLYVLLQM